VSTADADPVFKSLTTPSRGGQHPWHGHGDDRGAPHHEGVVTGAPVTRRALLVGAATVAVRTRSAAAETPATALQLDDASRLNRVPIARHWRPTQVTGDAWLDALRAELKAAAAEGRPVSVGAARHSMGGQALARAGVAVTLDVKSPASPAAAGSGAWIEPNRGARTYRVAAGARWGQVIRALDPLGFSPAVMQSNNDFGAAATLSVNAHGWPVPFGPFGSTVRSFRLMLASGELVVCTPAESAELFGLVNGGYGLLGVVVDVELAMAENTLLRPTHEVMPADKLGPRMAAVIAEDATIRMAYGRLAVDAERFLREALLVTYRPQAGTPPPAKSGGFVNAVSREMFRAQIGSDAVKRARWHAETVTAPRMGSGVASRNTLMNEPVANLAGRNPKRTDILHEYFLPPENLEGFLAACRAAIPSSHQDLLNVTLRYVQEDRLSVLAYARGTRIAAVMLFSQRMTRADDEDMAMLTRRLVDAALDAGGSYYLPYRLHARRDQLARAYPRLEEFLAGKRRYDPGLLFRNLMWDRYFSA
jgi:FAD/FMN-containing dehydrogenase